MTARRGGGRFGDGLRDHDRTVADRGGQARGGRLAAAVISNEAPPTPALPSGARALTPTPMKPGEPVGFQVARVLPLLSVSEAGGVSPVGLVLTVTWAPGTGAPFLVMVISTTCSWLARTFACFALTSTLSSAVALRLLDPAELELLLLGALAALVLAELLELLAGAGLLVVRRAGLGRTSWTCR